MDKQFDIFGTIQKEVQDFKQDRIRIAGSENNEDARYLKKETRGYFFSQYETLNLIDLYYNSKFETGQIDSEGQRKLFLNICAFRADVASKMIDLDTKDFVFIPDDESSKWLSWFISKEFKDWARENYFGELINDFVERFPKYGTIVSKKVGKKIENLPVRDIVIQQDAKSIAKATHFIHLHPKMTLDEMEEYPDWDTSGLELDLGKSEMVYERYGKVPKDWYEKTTGKKASKNSKNIDVVVICTLLQKTTGQTKSTTGTILFCEEADKADIFQEAHWKRQDGRWLGIGEIENLFENQISRNMIANLRRRSLLWSSKKIFQSSDETVSKNLIRDVKDGDVMRIMPNGNITQVDVASRQISEFQSTEEVWEKNSDQKSFTYDAATGENMPSGTPFRLGVIVSNAVASHFKLKKQKLGIFLKKIVVEDVYDIFLKENSKAHIATVFGTENGMNDLRKVAATEELNKRIFDWAMSDSTEIPNFDLWKQQIEQAYVAHSHLFVEIPDKAFNDAKHHVELTITGEEVDTATKVQNLTTLYQSLIQQQDPRAEQVLAKIMDLQGENLEAIIGAKPAAPQQQAPGQAQLGSGMPNPQLSTNQIQA